MNVDFKGYNENVATFIADNSVAAGKFVVMDENYSVKAASEDDEIFGYCVGVRDGYAAVQLEGYVEAPVSGDVDLGLTSIAAASATAVAASETAAAHKVVFVSDNVIGFIL
ncbi:MAG: hypothetical protein K6F88_03690 [Ruminococcus sp.]|nr:hypothetical protein [Ruminococcus sp.]